MSCLKNNSTNAEGSNEREYTSDLAVRKGGRGQNQDISTLLLSLVRYQAKMSAAGQVLQRLKEISLDALQRKPV
jgi:hypothetical protein